MKRKQQDLDSRIEQEYYRRACGVQIDIMNIPKLFEYVRQRVLNGADLGLTVQDAISKFRELNHVI